jgi:hypothetical protein
MPDQKLVINLETGEATYVDLTAEEQAERAQLEAAAVADRAARDAALTEHTAAQTDLRATAQQARDRLDDIIANGSGYAAAAVRDAVIDEARILRRLLRYLLA